ncbi:MULTISPECIES: hypothetical protein [Saccharothrix]|uniref:hypothetical protein n=1 Tax=Saccharothrix TaxID=2071 RepID=UPI0009402DFE|nr:hypothetical protein [Saccharothrix sp. CB00851]OKI15408.1 hypothetical protein A6A25_13920 [Saccharothrix sp. CB00851]
MSDLADEALTALLHEVAWEAVPRRFAVVEEHGEEGDVRVAGYGLAYADRVDVDAVEGGFRLRSGSAESARVLFEISSRSAGVRRVHLVWLDQVGGRA